MKKLLLLFALTALSCGRIPQPFNNGNIPHHIDPYFNPMIDRFRQDSEKADVGIGDFDRITVIEFSNDFPEKFDISFCDYNIDLRGEEIFGIKTEFYHNFYKIITFRPAIKNYDDLTIYKIFLHELGHCTYHLQHTHTDQNYIMNPIPSPADPNNFNLYKFQFFTSAQMNKSEWFYESLESN